jgi:hypothetical protein
MKTLEAAENLLVVASRIASINQVFDPEGDMVGSWKRNKPVIDDFVICRTMVGPCVARIEVEAQPVSLPCQRAVNISAFVAQAAGDEPHPLRCAVNSLFS